MRLLSVGRRAGAAARAVRRLSRRRLISAEASTLSSSSRASPNDVDGLNSTLSSYAPAFRAPVRRGAEARRERKRVFYRLTNAAPAPGRIRVLAGGATNDVHRS
jgi:hypothetical protein